MLIFILSTAAGLMMLLSMAVHKDHELIKNRTRIKRASKCQIT